MSGHSRPNSEARPGMDFSVTDYLPTPSTSGIERDRRLHFGDHNGTPTFFEQTEPQEQREEWLEDRIRRLVNQVNTIRSTRTVSPLLEEQEDGSFGLSFQIEITNDRVAQIEPLPPVPVDDTSKWSDDLWDSDEGNDPNETTIDPPVGPHYYNETEWSD